jgi:hypothetical protein
MSTKSNTTHIHELELMYWDTVIQVLGAWQNIYQPANTRKNIQTNSTPVNPWLEYILLSAMGLGIGIIIGAFSRL